MSEIIHVTLDENGYPNKDELAQAIDVIENAIEPYQINWRQFYAVLRDNCYRGLTRPEQITMNGKTIDVLAFHTCGWIGNEELISALQKTMIWDLLLIRYDRFGHYYFEVWS